MFKLIKKTVLNTALALILGVNFMLSAHAGVPLKDYEKFKKSESFYPYINGLGEGLKWANQMMEGKKKQPMYCQPHTAPPVKADFLIAIIEAEIKLFKETKSKTVDDFPIELLLIDGLMRAFPCN